MTPDGGAFRFTRPGTVADFDYRVEIGAAHSDWHRVGVLDPVDLADGTRVEIVPPGYATAMGRRTLPGFADFDGLAHGTAHFALRLDRPAAAVHFEWRPDGAARPELIAADLAPDGRSAAAALPLRAPGALKLVLVRDADGKRLNTELVARVTLTRDEPPRFEEVSGVSRCPRTARPGARIPVALVACDDMAVTGAHLEYVVGPDESKSVAVPILLTGGGTTRAAGSIDFALPGDLAGGDTIRVRLAVRDNRRIDEGAAEPDRLGPNVTTYPPSGWSEIKLTAAAPPLDLQDVACQRDALHGPLAAAATAVKEAADETAALRAATDGGALALDQSQAARLNALKERTRAAAEELLAAARDAALTTEMRPLAADVRAAAERHLKPAEDALRRAETDNAGRADAFAAAGALLADARVRLAELLDRNADFARDRLDRAALAALAADQAALAEHLQAGAADAPARQNELLDRLAGLIGGSPRLRAAAAAARGEDVRRLAGSLADLAARIRELDAAARDAAEELRVALAAGIVRDQDALAERAAAALGGLDTAARLAGLAPPNPDDFRRVAGLAVAGKTVAALAELERHAQAVAQLAATFEQWAADRADPKLAARQFAAWQADLSDRLEAAAKGNAYDKLPAALLAALRAEQTALHAAVEALALPPEVAKVRQSAALHTRVAADSLATRGARAAAAMKLAAEALTRLAAQTPATGERHRNALRALDPLRFELESSGNAVDQVLRGADRQPPDAAALAKKLIPQIDRQRKLVAGVLALDLPGMGERRARAAAALAAAAADMHDGSALDIQASQAWARREFERLKAALDGNPAPDAKADELHRRLAALAAALDARGADLTRAHVEPAGPVLQEAARQLTALVAPEAPALFNDARTAVQSAEVAVRDARPDEARRRTRAAAEALGRLADRLNGAESDYERLTRLAANRRLAAEKPKELLFSDEAVRQLAREADELTHTRVGAAGQTLKRRALDLYAKLRAKADPDRIGTDQKALTTTLDELAAKAADIAELAVADRRDGPAPGSGGADAFLPSKPHAEALRELEKRLRALHAHVAGFAAELAVRLRPAANNPLAAPAAEQRQLAVAALELARDAATETALKAADAALLASDRVRVGQVQAGRDAAGRAAALLHELAAAGPTKPWGRRAAALAARQDGVAAVLAGLPDDPGAVVAQQVARALQLAQEAGEVAAALELVVKSLPPDDGTRTAVLDAVKRARAADKQLSDAAKAASEADAAEAEKHRGAAEAALREGAAGIDRATPAAAPNGTNLAVGEALRAAERAMKEAAPALAHGGDAETARRAMRNATQALAEAAQRVGE
jgi:hypothetical protein